MKPQSGQTMRSRLSPSGTVRMLGPRAAGGLDMRHPTLRAVEAARQGDPAKLRTGERRHARQLASLEPFEEGAAGGRDIAELVDDAGMSQRRHRVAAACDAEQLALLGQRRDPLGNG